MFALYGAIEKISGHPGIGLKLGSDERPEHYGPIAIAALYTRSFRDAMDRIARYKSGRRRPERCDLRGRRPEPQRRDRRGVPYQVPPLRSNIREAAGEP